MVIHFAASGDEGSLRRRKTMALPLLARGVASIIPEHPFYGERSSKEFRPSSVPATFTDFLMMSRAAADEGVALIRYLKGEGFVRICSAGVSMGSYTAMAAAARSGEAVAIAACLPMHSARRRLYSGDSPSLL